MTFRTIHLFMAMTVIAVLLAIGSYLYKTTAEEQRIVAELESRGWTIRYQESTLAPEPESKGFWCHLWYDPCRASIWGNRTEEEWDADLQLLSCFSTLRAVDIHHPKRIRPLARLPGLRELNLHPARELQDEWAALVELPQLSKLRLEHAALTLERAGILAKCPSLKELTLASVVCYREDLEVLAESKTLESLNLESTDVSDEMYLMLVEWRGLKRLHILDWPASAEIASALRGRTDLTITTYAEEARRAYPDLYQEEEAPVPENGNPFGESSVPDNSDPFGPAR